MLTALQPNYIDGFASECARMGLSEDMTEFLYKHAVFRQKTQIPGFAEGFTEEFKKLALNPSNPWTSNVPTPFGPSAYGPQPGDRLRRLSRSLPGRGAGRFDGLVGGAANIGSKLLGFLAKHKNPTAVAAGVGIPAMAAGGYYGIAKPWLEERNNHNIFTRPTELSQYMGGSQPSAGMSTPTPAPSDPWNLIEGLDTTNSPGGAPAGASSTPSSSRGTFNDAYRDLEARLRKVRGGTDIASQVELMKQKALMDTQRSRLEKMRQWTAKRLPDAGTDAQRMLQEYDDQINGRIPWWKFWQHHHTPGELDVMSSKVRNMQDNLLLANKQLGGK